MDEPLKSILIAVGTIFAGAMISSGGYLWGRINSRKDAAKIALDSQSQRNRSEETFRSSFAEERIEREKIQRQMKFLYQKNKKQESTILDLTQQVTNLTTLVVGYREQVTKLELQVIDIAKERDAALEKLKGI